MICSTRHRGSSSLVSKITPKRSSYDITCGTECRLNATQKPEVGLQGGIFSPGFVHLHVFRLFKNCRGPTSATSPYRSSLVQPCKMFVPNPSNLLLRIILVFCQPKFSSFADHIKDLTSNIREVRKSSLASGTINVELVNACHREENIIVASRSPTSGRFAGYW